jgi:hypothetical protein
MSMKNSNDIIGNRTHDLPVCSAVPQPLRHRVHQHLLYSTVINQETAWCRVHLWKRNYLQATKYFAPLSGNQKTSLHYNMRHSTPSPLPLCTAINPVARHSHTSSQYNTQYIPSRQCSWISWPQSWQLYEFSILPKLFIQLLIVSNPLDSSNF